MVLTRDHDVEAFEAVGEAVPDRRVELLLGSIHVMNRPIPRHQNVLGNLYVWFRENLPTGWQPLIEVELAGEFGGQPLRLVPDLCVVPTTIDLDISIEVNDVRLAVEILSPSTRDRDVGVKAEAYAASGIEWYWIVDPANRTIDIRRLLHGAWMADNATIPWPAAVQFGELDEP